MQNTWNHNGKVIHFTAHKPCGYEVSWPRDGDCLLETCDSWKAVAKFFELPYADELWGHLGGRGPPAVPPPGRSPHWIITELIDEFTTKIEVVEIDDDDDDEPTANDKDKCTAQHDQPQSSTAQQTPGTSSSGNGVADIASVQATTSELLSQVSGGQQQLSDLTNQVVQLQQIVSNLAAAQAAGAAMQA
eukprot:4667616-Pyramimonas_sp.AAC.1